MLYSNSCVLVLYMTKEKSDHLPVLQPVKPEIISYLIRVLHLQRYLINLMEITDWEHITFTWKKLILGWQVSSTVGVLYQTNKWTKGLVQHFAFWCIIKNKIWNKTNFPVCIFKQFKEKVTYFWYMWFLSKGQSWFNRILIIIMMQKQTQ